MILKSIKAGLIQIGNEKMCQKVCLTSVDKDGKLLKAKPKSWDEINSRKFMIINSQHNIIASKVLQILGCVERDQRLNLAK